MANLRAEFVADDKESQFDSLKVYLTGETTASYAALAEGLGMSEGAVNPVVSILWVGVPVMLTLWAIGMLWLRRRLRARQFV